MAPLIFMESDKRCENETQHNILNIIINLIVQLWLLVCAEFVC